jgi:hypothetical protein
MSLIVTVYVPSGIVMAADSRMSILRTEEREEKGEKSRLQQHITQSDNAYKVVALSKVGAGISLFDAAIIHNQPVDALVQRFEEEALTEQDNVTTVADKFLAHCLEKYPNVGIGFHVGGYRTEDRASIPYVLFAHSTQQKEVRRVNLSDKSEIQYGVVRHGDVAVANRLIDKNQIPFFNAMPLQDAVDYAIHLIRTTIDTLRFEPRYSSVGGPIDVLVVTPAGMRWVQRKELRGEG